MPRIKHLHTRLRWTVDGIAVCYTCGCVFKRYRVPRERVTGGVLQMWHDHRFQERRAKSDQARRRHVT